MPSETVEGDEEDIEGQLGSRNHRIRLIRFWLIPLLDSPEWNERYEPDPDSVKQSADILAKEYYDLAAPEFYSTISLIILLLLVDHMLFINVQIYGLFIDIWAAVFLIFPSLKGRYITATSAEGTPAEAIHRLEAQEMVSANIGFVFLALGFILQVLSIQLIPSGEFLQANQLAPYVPSWATIVLLLGAIGISSKILANLRDKRLSEGVDGKEP